MAPTIACEFCGAPVRVTSDKAHRLKYHPACKREVDRIRANARRAGAARPRTEHECEECGQAFQAKRSDARYCSVRCRVKASRSRATDAHIQARRQDTEFMTRLRRQVAENQDILERLA